MKGISIATCFDYQIPIEQQFQMIKNIGFDCISIGGKYAHSGILEKAGIDKIKALCKEYQLGIDTIHGYAMDKADTLDINEKLAVAAEILGVPTIVLHCSSFTFNFPLLMEVMSMHSQYKNTEEFLQITYSKAQGILNEILTGK